jgi:hypothetical protein
VEVPGHACLAALGHYVRLGTDIAERITREDDPANRRRAVLSILVAPCSVGVGQYDAVPRVDQVVDSVFRAPVEALVTDGVEEVVLELIVLDAGGPRRTHYTGMAGLGGLIQVRLVISGAVPRALTRDEPGSQPA